MYKDTSLARRCPLGQETHGCKGRHLPLLSQRHGRKMGEILKSFMCVYSPAQQSQVSLNTGLMAEGEVSSHLSLCAYVLAFLGKCVVRF